MAKKRQNQGKKKEPAATAKEIKKVKKEPAAFVISEVPQEKIKTFKFWGFAAGFLASVFSLIFIPPVVYLYFGLNFTGVVSWIALGVSFVVMLAANGILGYVFRRKFPSAVIGVALGLGFSLVLATVLVIFGFIAMVWAAKAMKV